MARKKRNKRNELDKQGVAAKVAAIIEDMGLNPAGWTVAVLMKCALRADLHMNDIDCMTIITVCEDELGIEGYLPAAETRVLRTAQDLVDCCCRQLGIAEPDQHLSPEENLPSGKSVLEQHSPWDVTSVYDELDRSLLGGSPAPLSEEERARLNALDAAHDS